MTLMNLTTTVMKLNTLMKAVILIENLNVKILTLVLMQYNFHSLKVPNFPLLKAYILFVDCHTQVIPAE